MTVALSDPALLAQLFPAQLLGGTEPVISDPPPEQGVPLVGAPKSLFVPTLNQKTRNTEGAATLRIDPLPSGTDATAIRLFVNGIQDDVKPILPGDEDKIIHFLLFQGSLYDGVNVIHYVVDDAAGNSAESTPLWVMYSSTLPGGNDVPGSGDHPYLILTLPSPGDWFDKDDFPLYLTASYPYTKPYDVITLILNGKPFEFTVQPGEETGDYVIEVTAQMIAQAGNSPTFSFVFTVRDQLGNSTYQRRRSAPRLANVDINRTTVSGPDLIERLADANDIAHLVHLENLDDGVLHFLIHIFAPLYQVGDKIVTDYICTPASGSAATFSSEATVTRIPFTADLPVPAGKVLVTGLIRAKYKVMRGDQVIAVSQTTEATVVSPTFITPTITRVADPAPYNIPQGGSTIYSSIKVSGYCTAKLSVEIFDGATSYGTVPADATGYWSRDIAGLALGPHNIHVVAVYDQNLKASHAFTVKVLAPPAITRVTGANGRYIPPGGTAKIHEWLRFSGTCDSLPYPRWVLLNFVGGGYAWLIPAFATQWVQQGARVVPGDVPHNFSDRRGTIHPYPVLGPTSPTYRIIWTK